MDGGGKQIHRSHCFVQINIWKMWKEKNGYISALYLSDSVDIELRIVIVDSSAVDQYIAYVGIPL
jgi:hypothetical protein